MNGGNFAGSSLSSGWGGYVNAGAIYDGYFFFYGAMPVDVCLKLLPMMTRRISGLIVNDAWVMGRGTADRNAVPSPGELVSACDDAGGSPVPVYFIFED